MFAYAYIVGYTIRTPLAVISDGGCESCDVALFLETVLIGLVAMETHLV